VSVKQPKAKKEHRAKKPAEETAPPPPTEDELVDQVAEWILAGNSHADVVAAVLHTWPDTKLETARDLLDKAYEYLEGYMELGADQRKAWHCQARRELYRRALEIHDYKTAHAILKELASLDGTGAPRGRQPEPAPTFEDDGVPDGDGLEIPTN
jgi:hypothetical protein